MAESNFLMKDSINPKVIKELAGRLKRHHKRFDEKAFAASINKKLPNLELKQPVAGRHDLIATKHNF